MNRRQILFVALAMALALIAGAHRGHTGSTGEYVLVAATNLALLSAALWLALPVLGGAVCLLLFAGPTLWWIDKPPQPIVAFCVLTMALSGNIWRARPSRPAGPAEPQGSALQVAGILAVASVVLSPMVGHPVHWPTWAEWIAVPFDPAVGVVANFPALAIAVVAAIAILVARRERLVTPDRLVACGAAVLLCFAASQRPGAYTSGTPGPSPYVNWLIPLAIPFVRGMHARGTPRQARGFRTLAVASALACVMLFHPATEPLARQPTVAAAYLWERHPSWHDPLPAVFANIINRGEARVAPAATRDCEKILAIGGLSPAPCFPVVFPPDCARDGALCYANRRGDRYDVARAPGHPVHHTGFRVEPEFAWPPGATDLMRDLLTEWDWPTLRASDSGVLREAQRVRVMELAGDSRRVFFLRQPRSGARIALRLPWRAEGALVDAATGQTLRPLEFTDEPQSRWDIDVPADFDLLLVLLRAS